MNTNHEEGKHKARVFASALGLRAADAEWMCDQLLKAAAHEDASLTCRTRFGSLYVLDFEVETEAGSATVRSGWIIRHHEDFPRLTTCCGRPSLPRRTLQVQTIRNALRCPTMTVSGFTITKAERHSVHTRESPMDSTRSELFNRRRFFADR
jgi:hypothetical protein